MSMVTLQFLIDDDRGTEPIDDHFSVPSGRFLHHYDSLIVDQRIHKELSRKKLGKLARTVGLINILY